MSITLNIPNKHRKLQPDDDEYRTVVFGDVEMTDAHPHYNTVVFADNHPDDSYATVVIEPDTPPTKRSKDVPSTLSKNASSSLSSQKSDSPTDHQRKALYDAQKVPDVAYPQATADTSSKPPVTAGDGDVKIVGATVERSKKLLSSNSCNSCIN